METQTAFKMCLCGNDYVLHAIVCRRCQIALLSNEEPEIIAYDPETGHFWELEPHHWRRDHKVACSGCEGDLFDRVPEEYSMCGTCHHRADVDY
jgi:hypothetical protein